MNYRKSAIGCALTVLIGTAVACYGWALVHYRTAERALTRGDFAGAQQHLASCLKVWFWSADTYLLAARTARRAGDLDQAASYLKDCRSLGGADDAIDLEYKLLSVKQGNLAAAELSLFNLMKQNHPATPLIGEVLTPVYLQSYQLNNALPCVERWLQDEPECVEAWRYRAKLYELLQNGQETLASYGRVVQLDPEDDESRLLFAGQLANFHRPQEALEQFEYLRPRLGEVPEVLAGIAGCKRELNLADEARQLLDRVVAQDPHNALALRERSRLALQCESAAEAENWSRRALVEWPNDRDLLYGLFQCLRQAGKQSEAGDVQAKLDKIEKELDRLREITRQIASTPHNADLRCEAGEIMLRNGQAEGLHWLASALHEDPNHAATHRALAEYRERTGDRQGAARAGLSAGGQARDRGSDARTVR